MSKIVTGKKGEKLLFLGNEALVRGAIEAGVAFVSCYPGTPSSEVPNTLFAVQKEAGLYAEFAANEKVAMEAAGSAAVAGIRSLTAMKHVGMNVAADPMMTLVYMGVRAGFVIYDADDPSMFSSQNEQDNRYFAKFACVPLLEPVNVQEMKDMTVKAFEISEQLSIPVIVRSTTRIAHSRGAVELGDVEKPITKKKFIKSPAELVPLPANARAMHPRLLKKESMAKDISEESPWNIQLGTGMYGIITSGVSFNYVMDAIKELDFEKKVAVLKLGMTNPLPRNKITNFLRNMKKVLVVEELEPFLEDAVKCIAQEEGLSVPIKGKGTGKLSRLFEYDPLMVKEAIAAYFGIDFNPPAKLDLSDRMELPVRPPNLCAGCPHRMTYYAVKQESDADTVFANDIGCYTLGYLPPYHMADMVMCMGASISGACGISKASGQKVVSFIGDSTFFHSGMTGVINAVFNKHNFTLVILDNGTTAMTGHQPSAAADTTGTDMVHIDLKQAIQGLGVGHVQVITPKNIAKAREAVRSALDYEGFSVIISREPCPLHKMKMKKDKKLTFTVNTEKCTKCGKCYGEFACPAFYLSQETVHINPNLCIGCAVCTQLCQNQAIRPIKQD